ncbi:MAG: squalene--hopene cyclase [Anaerolineales bacterium]|nr:squalene--hopene cyclase [Anaerolineales bacterium]
MADARPPIPDLPEPSRLQQAIQRTQDWLLERQAPGGYWAGALEADASTTAGYITLMTVLFGWLDPGRRRKAIAYIASKQNPDGSWATHYGGPGDLDVSIQCYLGLKIGGVPADDPMLQRSCEFIRSKGGPSKANVFTKIWLAVFGQYDYRGVPSLPPEIIFLPPWFYFNIYEFASWSRETLMALSIVLTNRPVYTLPANAGIDELFSEPPSQRNYSLGPLGTPFSWRAFFLIADRLLKLYEKTPWKPGRKSALRRVEAWVVEHQEADGSWGGILLPWIYSLFALHSLGYPMEHPVISRSIEGLEDFILEEKNTIIWQPATSPVWDTAWSVVALRDSGLRQDHPALRSAAAWLLSKEIRHRGDWQVKNPGLEPGGWSFEFFNDWYPDLDDSALAPRALMRAALSGEAASQRSAAVRRAVDWMTQMQSSDGGWGAFDRDNNRQALLHVPFADFLTPLDPTCADVTAHAIEMLVELDLGQTNIERGVAFLKAQQQKDGAWYGRWGVNYLYGTGLALTALAAAGEDMRAGYIRRAVDWLYAKQNPDGGWGETCMTYSDPALRGAGPSTASQTAWVVTGLTAAGEAQHPNLLRGVEFLLETQQPDGSWVEPYFTGTGFPRVFYLRYDLYRIYFPLLALARYSAAVQAVEQHHVAVAN